MHNVANAENHAAKSSNSSHSFRHFKAAKDENATQANATGHRFKADHESSNRAADSSDMNSTFSLNLMPLNACMSMTKCTSAAARAKNSRNEK